MGDQHKEDIWQREDPRKIMKEARKRFHKDGDHVALASTHYSLVKRYVSPKWKAPLAVWHMWRAATLAHEAQERGLRSFDQIDVVSTILAKAPRWLGGDKGTALSLVDNALSQDVPEQEMSPHTRAFLLIRKGELEMAHLGKPAHGVLGLYKAAEALDVEIAQECDRLTAMRQLTRVTFSIALFYMDHARGLGPALDYEVEGTVLMRAAIDMAQNFSVDQYQKIADELKKRGSNVHWYKPR